MDSSEEKGREERGSHLVQEEKRGYVMALNKCAHVNCAAECERETTKP